MAQEALRGQESILKMGGIMSWGFWVFVAVIVGIIVWLVSIYNGLVALKNRFKNAFSQIDVQLKRRYDLIPNLVETVKGYAAHERTVFENVTKARSALMGASSLADKAKANDQLSGALKSLFAVAEAYPDLKASENFKELQDELSDTETKVAASRQFYNTNVLDLNNSLETFSSNTVGNMFGFTKEPFSRPQIQKKLMYP